MGELHIEARFNSEGLRTEIVRGEEVTVLQVGLDVIGHYLDVSD